MVGEDRKVRCAPRGRLPATTFLGTGWAVAAVKMKGKERMLKSEPTMLGVSVYGGMKQDLESGRSSNFHSLREKKLFSSPKVKMSQDLPK